MPEPVGSDSAQTAGGEPRGVFLSYRGGDQPWAAVLLDYVLSRELGADAVFRDSRSLAPGTRFDTELLAAVRRSAVLLVVIGDRWLHARNLAGQRAIDDKNDWVRREIIAAFDCKITVIPVLIGDVPMLCPRDLPRFVRPLAICQYIRLQPRDSERDVAHLLRLVSACVNDPGGEAE